MLSENKEQEALNLVKQLSGFCFSALTFISMGSNLWCFYLIRYNSNLMNELKSLTEQLHIDDSGCNLVWWKYETCVTVAILVGTGIVIATRK